MAPSPLAGEEGGFVRELASRHREQVLDLLGERLRLERTSVGLYARVIEAARASGQSLAEQLAGELEVIRAQEAEHARWLEEQIRALGGDPDEETARARLAARESAGLEEVANGASGTAGLPGLFHTLLTAELVDTAGWALLLDLAERAGDDPARAAFRQRLRQEEEHLATLREAVGVFARRDVLGGSPSASP